MGVPDSPLMSSTSQPQWKLQEFDLHIFPKCCCLEYWRLGVDVYLKEGKPWWFLNFQRSCTTWDERFGTSIKVLVPTVWISGSFREVDLVTVFLFHDKTSCRWLTCYATWRVQKYCRRIYLLFHGKLPVAAHRVVEHLEIDEARVVADPQWYQWYPFLRYGPWPHWHL